MGRRLVWVAAVVGLLAVAGIGVFVLSSGKPRGCTDALGCVEIPAGGALRLGVIQALTGKVASLGLDQLRGLELALEDRGGKLLGHPVELVIEDTGCRPEGGANAALRIVSDPSVVAIFGTTCSGDAAAAAQVMTEAGLSMISGNNSAPFLTAIAGKRAPKWQPGYFRTASNEEHSGPAAARFAYEVLGVRGAAMMHDGDIYTRGLAEGFRTEFERLGGRTVLFAAVDKGDADMRPVLEAVVASKAELLFFPLFQPEGNYVLLAARSMPELAGVTLMSDGSLIENTFISAVGEASKGMYFVGPTPPQPGPVLDALRGHYREKYRAEPATDYYTSAYDAAGILFAALERAAVPGQNGQLVIGRQALRDALAATAQYPGVGGQLRCDSFGDCATPRFNVLRMDDPAKGVAGLTANVVYTYAPR
ncbi:Branched-chain amino acid ABC transporter, amino acid-binding protein [Desulfovibrio sp. DV]|uniref:branched-chain amino acid ABC transporter substrate-binding protein n=1 Tax=Desulfovibrio sp. DV TaxID=1844708 RepID=UPI00094BC36A|nr:branched-chain amino acid ABC transporter substrate-binding protein [Desulfovibrio sp. DV]OLN25507.1 Branched-chain amino acid ABC transporter, amino acid-binding protein [Desulfovibrio sp. DV]